MTILLRAAAVAIAVAGLVDPAFSVATRQPSRLVVAVLGDATPEALQAAMRVGDGMGPTAEATIRVVPATSDAAACPSGQPCVLVQSGEAPQHLMAHASTLAGAVLAEPEPSRIRVVTVDGSPEQHPAATGRLRVHLAGPALRTGVHVDVRDGDALVGDADVPAGDRESAAVEVSWWPMESGPRQLMVRARSADGNADEVAVGVNVVAATYDVVTYDMRPSWASAFLRRAIETDPRFHVRSQSRLGPDLAVGTAVSIRLDAATLTGASVVIIGGPEALTAADAALLERFVRVRGGSLILVPDRALSGPVARLAPAGLRERLERAPLAVGPLRATELLIAKMADVSHALASTGDGQAAIVATPLGEGRIIFSGAMDAWRYRGADDAAFDGFWRALVADAAAAGGRPLDVVLTPAAVAPGEPLQIEVRMRSLEEQKPETRVSLEARCGDQPAAAVRVWPSGRSTLAGVFTSASAGACEVRASIASPQTAQAEGAFLVAERLPRTPPDDTHRLQALAAAFDAPVVRAGGEGTLVTSLQGRLHDTTGATVPADFHPMRSPWWMVPFVACLGVEWWLRRRQGLR